MQVMYHERTYAPYFLHLARMHNRRTCCVSIDSMHIFIPMFFTASVSSAESVIGIAM